MHEQNRIRRRRQHALMDVNDMILDVRGRGPLRPTVLSRLRGDLRSADRALSRVPGAPPLSAWPEDRPPDSAEAMRRLLTARYALIHLLRPVKGPLTGRKRQHDLKKSPARYAPTKTYPR